MRGPLCKPVLVDQFKLKIHRETREVPVYELTVAKGGPKLPPYKEGHGRLDAAPSKCIL
jgi:uncharacterized protein (TIGR03435 family)